MLMAAEAAPAGPAPWVAIAISIVSLVVSIIALAQGSYRRWQDRREAHPVFRVEAMPWLGYGGKLQCVKVKATNISTRDASVHRVGFEPVKPGVLAFHEEAGKTPLPTVVPANGVLEWEIPGEEFIDHLESDPSAPREAEYFVYAEGASRVGGEVWRSATFTVQLP